MKRRLRAVLVVLVIAAILGAVEIPVTRMCMTFVWERAYGNPDRIPPRAALIEVALAALMWPGMLVLLVASLSRWFPPRDFYLQAA